MFAGFVGPLHLIVTLIVIAAILVLVGYLITRVIRGGKRRTTDAVPSSLDRDAEPND